MAKTQNGERGAIDLLAQDHKRIHKLFKDFEKVDRNDPDAVRELVETACLELQIHSMLEEEIFYPAMRGQAKAQHEDMLNRSEVEHEAVDELIAKLHALEPDDPMYYAYFAVLADHVKHHIRHEEQTLFASAGAMGGLNLEQLGGDMRLRREELFAEMERGEEEDAAAESTALEGSALSDDADLEADETLEDEQEQIDISRTRH